MPQDAVPKIDLTCDFSNLRVAVIGALWNKEISDSLIQNAEEVLQFHKVNYQIFRVAGSFELIWAAKQAINLGFSAIAIFGVIIRGETPHFEYVSSAVTQGATQLSLGDAIVGFGVLTCDTYQQALDRSGNSDAKENKGKDTIEAILLSYQAFSGEKNLANGRQG